MPGKRDQGSHSAAIAKVEQALPHADVIRAHLNEVLNSAALRGSHRSREFLNHVVECALSEKWERLKERSLGIDVFSRDTCYDTRADSIVRVTASDVRRRLTQYYSECAQVPAFRIELPAGSYIPEFDGFGGLVVPIPYEHSRRFGTNDSNGASPVIPLAPRQSIRPGFRTTILFFVVACLSWLVGVGSARLIPTKRVQPGDRYEFYRDLLGPIATDAGRETEIVLSNPRQDYTGLGEAVAAFNVGRLMYRIDRPIRLTEARFLNWAAARKVHFILLGAPQMSSWVQECSPPSNFAMEHDAITNARPLPGELKAYRPSGAGDVLDDYGLIWMARSPAGSRQLLMAGLTSVGTAGVGDFFCDPDRMRPVYAQLRAAARNGSIPSDWQVLLHVHARDNVPLEVSLVSFRANGTNR